MGRRLWWCKSTNFQSWFVTAAMVVQITKIGFGRTEKETSSLGRRRVAVWRRGAAFFFLSRGFEREKMKRYCVEKRNAAFFLCFAFEPLIWFMSTCQSSVYGTGELEHRRNGADLNSLWTWTWT
ncbi:hypothetical protein QL285_059894 [Trifolium repens]|nr:hypothetical protein QL285_059894 [Trifolium repens]